MISSNQRVTHSQIEEVHTFGRGGIKMANSSKWHTRWKPRRYHRIYYSKCVFSFHRLCVCYILARLFLFILSFFFFQEKNRRLNENDPRYWLVIFDDIAEGRVKVPFLPWLIACLNFFIIISFKYFHFNCKYKLLLYDKIFTCFEVDRLLILFFRSKEI